jgi:phosphate transport system substrate-binding protein
MMPSSQALGDEVASNPASIGYFGLGWFDERRHKAIAVAQSADSDYVNPSRETATTGEYPIAREMYLYTAGEPSANVRKFIDFVLSDEGQEIVSQQDFVPIQ